MGGADIMRLFVKFYLPCFAIDKIGHIYKYEEERNGKENLCKKERWI